MKHIIPNWQFLSYIGKSKILAPSSIAIILVPIISRLSSDDFNIHDIIFILDSTLVEIPNNMLRSFWGGVAIIFGQIVYLFGCPSIIKQYKSYYEWLNNSSEAATISSGLRKKYGKENQDKYEFELKKTYYELISSEENNITLVRLLSCFLYAVGIYLYILVIFSQSIFVFNVTSFNELFFI